MRVAHIISTGALAGTERYLINLVQYSRQTQIVVCPPHSPLMAELRALDNVNVIGQSFDYWHFPLHIWRMTRLLRQEGVDVVHTHLGRATLFGIVAAWLAGVPVRITTQHFISPAYATTHPRLSYPLFLLGHRLINRLVSGTIAISKAVRAETSRREHVTTDSVHLIPHGLDISRYRSAPTRDHAQPVIVTIARLEHEKGLTVWLDALPHIIAAVPNVCIVLAGDGHLYQTLLDHARQLGLTDHVRLPGFCSDVPALLRSADLYVHPAPNEPFGIAVLEAMAAQLPVVAINAGGPAEIVVHGETGLLVHYSAAALADATISLLYNPTLRQRMGAAGQKRVEAEYTVTRMVAQTEELYARLLRQQGREVKVAEQVHSEL